MYKNLIGGDWVDGSQVSHNINPSNVSDVVGDYAQGAEQDVEQAVAAARQALPAWASASPQVRHDVLDAVGNAILARKDEIGRL
ncbi:MAG: aldehyde dehydrogenase family protein, partial [Candidatus Competibacteraceae bacterium]|nr:aldehyde dehydrogenase family protein [Candidatus Competibacteraceae bacterium]